MVLTALIAAGACVATPVPPAAAAPPTLPNPNAHGITLTAWRQVDPSEPATQPRMIDATMRTDAIYVGGTKPEIKVRILLPANYQTDPSRPYPVLWLLHGGAGDWDDWSNNGTEGIVANSPFQGIVVMPEGGSTGYFTDWHGNADGGFRPQWERFHMRQLLPWIDANFNTVESREGRAIAGASMGGFGALKYAGQHPDLFGAVGSFSGGANIRLRSPYDIQEMLSQHMQWSGAAILSVNFFDLSTRVNLYEWPWPWPVQDPDRQREYRVRTLFGPQENWPNVNPYDMASRFPAYNGRMALYTGGENGSGEANHHYYNVDFRQALDRHDVDYRWCVGNGDHSWSFWQRDLRDFLFYLEGTPVDCHYDAG